MSEPDSKNAPGEEGLRDSEARFRLLVESVRDYAIFMLDPSGHVLTWNAGAQNFNGYRAEEIIGSHFSRFYPSEALARDLPAHELREAAAHGSYEDEGWRVRKDGSLLWANVVITAMRDDRGKLVGYAKVTRDLTQRRRHEEELRLSEERFRLLVEGVSDYAIFMLDPNGRIATWNVGAQRIKGYAADEIIGKHFSVFYPAEARDSGWPEHELHQATETGRFLDTGWRLRKDGTAFWASVTITAMRDARGRLIGFAKLTRDLTQERRVEAMEVESAQREEILDAERNARMAAQRAARLKDEFLATLSHELRTPLSAILGWTQLLLRKSAEPVSADHRRALEVIDRSARAQVQLIDDLLDLSRIITGKLRLDLKQVSMARIVESATEAAMPAAEAKDIRVKLVINPSPVTVSADSARLQQVVWNLLSNAIKFTPKGGQVQVLLQRVNSHIELSVSDTGIGMHASFLPQVFDRFTQQDGSSTRAYGGLGLGLAICKQLVELHGGSIRAASPGENLGSTFYVELPVSILKWPEHEPDLRRREHPTAPENEGEGERGDGIALPRLDGIHVMVVDDEQDARDLLQRVLEGQGARVTPQSSGAQALGLLRVARPDAIISDVGMPDMDGYQMMRTLRASEGGNTRIPAVALTAFARAEDRKRSLLAGYQAHLAKPFDLAELVLVVAGLVGR